MSGQAAQMNQVGGSGVGGGTDGLPQDHQMQDVVRLGMGIDPQFVMLRNNMREKIFEYIGRKRSSADRRRRLPELAWRLEEILFRKFPDKNEYYNMRKLRVEPQLQFAIKTSSAQLRKMPDLLVHASTCRSGSCQYPNCPEVKGLFRHGKQCQIRASGGCALCKKMWSTLQLHARACRDSGCSVPRCRDLKEHLTRLQQLSDSSRRAAVMK